MKEISNRLSEEREEMFEFLKADKVHPHDKFLGYTVLQLIPEFITPNIVTTVRLILTPVVFFLVFNNYYESGIILFLIVAFTDAMDGSLARLRDQITKFGMMYDPLADKLLIGSMIVLIVFDVYSIWLAMTVLGIEIIFIIIATIGKIKFKTTRMANIWGKMKMISQVIAVFLTLAGLLLHAPQFFTFGAWIFGLAIGFAIVSLFSHGI
ncbi:MAG: CDP-alcohol phosphatidyltransferase family protein [Candidatus Paceibacteria bacterium]